VTGYEIIDIALSIGNRIDLQWGLFITVHVALLGAIVYIDRPLRRVEKIAALLMYCGFALVNYQQMNSQLRLVGSAYADIELLSHQDEYQNIVVIQKMAGEAQQGRAEKSHLVLTSSHVFMFVLVFVSIIFDSKILSRETPKREPADTG
jgi:Ca2+/Na+ antiporter